MKKSDTCYYMSISKEENSAFILGNQQNNACPEAVTTTEEKEKDKSSSGNQQQSNKSDGINLKVHLPNSLYPSECCLHGLLVSGELQQCFSCFISSFSKINKNNHSKINFSRLSGNCIFIIEILLQQMMAKYYFIFIMAVMGIISISR